MPALGPRLLARGPLVVPQGPRRPARAPTRPGGDRRAGSLVEARREAAEKAERIDLAVVDLLLPDGIGTELIRDLRADGSGVPVLVLTVAQGPDLRAWVRSMGADEMISKDASVEEILAAIRVLLRG